MDALRVIGMDLALRSTGLCLPDGTTRRIVTGDRGGDARMLSIRNAVRTVLRAYAREGRPVHVAILEDIPQNSHAAKPIGMVHGLIRAELLALDVPYALVTGATLKCYATDNGNADKDRMAVAALDNAGVAFSDDPKGDRCDAWWLRVAGMDHYGHAPIPLPAAQRIRLEKVQWPVLLGA